MSESPEYFLDHELSENKILFGYNEDKNIIGAFLSNPNEPYINVYRHENDQTIKEAASFYPFFHLIDKTLLNDFPGKHWLKELEGSGAFKTICVFNSWTEMWEAIQYVSANFLRTRGERLDLSSNDPLLLRNDPACQYFLQNGRTCFKGMNLSDLHRMQISCVFRSTHGSSNADRDSDHVLAIDLSDNHDWSELLLSKKRSEKNLLEKLIEYIHDRDPDTIEGNYFHSFELPYLITRCEKHAMTFNIGRDHSTPTITRSKSTDAEIEFAFVQVHGRYILDTSRLITQHGYSRQDRSQFDLHETAKVLSYHDRKMEPIHFRQYSWYYEHDFEKLTEHLNHNLKEIDIVCKSFSAPAFFLSRTVPLNFDSQFQIGNAAKIELLMMREYIRQHQAIPKAEITTQTSGGYADIFYTGLFHPIMYLDIESMYPSIMISNNFAPKSDDLRIFLSLLEKLTSYRIELKRNIQSASETVHKNEFEALQTSLKFLINSFYGYLSYSRALFNDSEIAEAVVQEGRKILNNMIHEIRSTGGTPIEVDTDGVYLIPPSYVDDEHKENNFIERLAVTLPPFIHISLVGRYKKMLSYKIKNYALLDYEDHLIIRGSSLTAKNMEKFAKHFMEACIECLLRDDVMSIHELYRNLIFDFQNRKLQVWDFAKTESLRTSVEDYQKHLKDASLIKKIHSSVHEALIRSSRYAKIGESVSYYFTGNDSSMKPHEMARIAEEWQSTSRDENIGYYIKRIDELSARFKIFFSSQDFRQIFSAEDDLFGFNPDNVKIISGPALQLDSSVDQTKSD